MMAQKPTKEIVIFGRNGQVARNLIKLFAKENDCNVRAFSSLEVDFSNLDELLVFLQRLSPIPDFIINAAAYTAVDKAEEEKELADLINHKAVKILSDYAVRNNVMFIHYSTDYVFDGSGNEPFLEDNIKNLHPLNVYGQTKLDGENAIIKSNCKHIILRTSWVFDSEGKNFSNTIKKLAREREVLTIIDDQIGAPTIAKDIASATIKIIKNLSDLGCAETLVKKEGIYHITSNKYISWYDFAIDIVDNLKKHSESLMVKEIRPIKTSEYKTAAMRPLNSKLNCNKLKRVFGIEIPYNPDC